MCEFPVNRLTTTEVASCTTQFDLGVSSGLRSFTFFFPCKNERKNKNKKRHETSSSPGSTICVKKKSGCSQMEIRLLFKSPFIKNKICICQTSE